MTTTRPSGFGRPTSRGPESRLWSALVEVVTPELENPAWDPPLADDHLSAGGGPLIDGLSLPIDPRRLTSLVSRLRAVAEASELTPTASIDLETLAAAVRMLPVDPLAHLASLPVLAACRRVFASRIPNPWPQGWCRVCGAWPVLAELRGLERERRLRCGRCGDDWGFPWLRCVFCGEGRHERLSALVPEGAGESRRVEGCRECRGALKSVATLGALSHSAVLLTDGETIELDVAAVENGYRRPSAQGLSVSVRPTRRP